MFKIKKKVQKVHKWVSCSVREPVHLKWWIFMYCFWLFHLSFEIQNDNVSFLLLFLNFGTFRFHHLINHYHTLVSFLIVYIYFFFLYTRAKGENWESFLDARKEICCCQEVDPKAIHQYQSIFLDFILL